MAFSWKLKCPPKSRHFVWQILYGTLPVSKNLKAQESIVTHAIACVGQMMSPLTMCFLNVHQHYKHGHFPGSLPLRQFFHRLRFSPVLIIYFGDCRRRMTLVISLGYYGIFGRQEMIRSTQTRMETRWRFFGWLMWNVRFGRRLN